MDKISEIERLKLDIASIDEFLGNSKTYIENAKRSIDDVGKEENSLRLLYPDVCELDEIKEKIESTKNMQDDVGDDVGDLLNQRMQSLQKGLDMVLERLSRYGIKSRDDYNNMMNEVLLKKESIANIRAEIKKKELELIKIEERKKTILARIEYLENDNANVVEDSEAPPNIDVHDEVLSEDMGEKERVVSELAAFIDYQSEDDEVKDEVIDSPEVNKEEVNKKKDSVDGSIEDILKGQEKVQNKFLEIMQDNKEEEVSKEIKDFHNKFLETIYKRLNDAIEKFVGKRKLINELNVCISESTKEKEDERLTNLNNEMLSSIKNIEQEEQCFEGEIKYSFDEFSSYAKSEFNYLCTLRSRIEDQLTEINTKIDNIENELGEIKENTKESILEAINNNQKSIDNTDKKLRNVDSLLRENILMLMDNIKDRMNVAKDHNSMKAILEDFRNCIIEKEEEADSKKMSIEEEIKKLEEEKKILEEKYNKKKDNDANDIERETLLLDSKKMLKEEVQKVVEMVGMLKTRYTEFKAKLSEGKRSIKDKIKQYDDDIVTKKNYLTSSIIENMKSYKLRLFENIEEYNNEYIKEFDRYATKIMIDIEDLKKENDILMDKVHNVVVSSEFEENITLFDQLKESLDKIISTNKRFESIDKPSEQDESKINQTIKINLSYIKPENTIDNKIDFGSIYEIEDNMQMIDDLKESIVNVCNRLEMDYNTKIKKEKVVKRLNEKDRIRDNVVGLEGYDNHTKDILMDMSWEYVEELKSMNVVYNKCLYLDDLKNIKDEKVMSIAKLKEDYQAALDLTRKLYDLKKYVLAYKKGMEELAKGAKSNDKEAQKEYNKFMKLATKSLKTMQENGISSFEDFRNKVMKNSEHVKKILSKTKTENEELVRITSIIKAIEIATNVHKESNDIAGMV